MKKNYLLGVFLLGMFHISAQQVVPQLFQKTKLSQKPTTTVVSYHKLSTKDSVYSKVDSTLTFQNDENESDDWVQIYGIGSTDALQFDKLSAAATLTAGVKLTKTLNCLATFNYSGKINKQEDGDSITLNEIYFPDIANAALGVSMEWCPLSSFSSASAKSNEPTNSFIEGADLTLQNKTIVKDSIDYKLGILNFDLGLKYRWSYLGRKNIPASIVIGGYFNYVLVSDNSNATFNSIYQTPSGTNLNAHRSGISFLFSCQVSNSILYARTFTDLALKGDLAFTVGIKQAIKFKSF